MNCSDKTNRAGHVVQHALIVHEVPRLHAVLALIHDIAAGPAMPDALADIARLARCALVVSMPPDPQMVETRKLKVCLSDVGQM
ncbi:hypothetical protein [Paraburkholderia sp. HD33-4]|uniref:hypothetical protein n=1 Tax=Paraburkholderia sp. HD33-4 TaxID=2883242 RepID=UPI001F388C59|nr:hypothetical protein [Paraburkholderia sp. HD33-4]